MGNLPSKFIRLSTRIEELLEGLVVRLEIARGLAHPDDADAADGVPLLHGLQEVEPGDGPADRGGRLVEPSAGPERQVEVVGPGDAEDARAVVLEGGVRGQRQARDG